MTSSRRQWQGSRFDAQDDEPLGPLANLVDIMLVFACGLIVALAANSEALREQFSDGGQPIQKGRELPEIPPGVGEAGSGFKSMGRVYQDPETGKLILIGDSK